MPTAENLGVGRVTKRRSGVGAGGLPVADSRPTFVNGRVAGSRCGSCRHPSAQRGLPWCPVCYSEMDAEEFVPSGIAWSSVVVAIPVNDLAPPFALAYVDLDDGPRVLARLVEPVALPVDTRVRIVGAEAGDLIADSDAQDTPEEDS